MNIFETLKKLSKKDNQERKDPSYIYLDGNQIKERPLPKSDSSASALVNQVKNPAKMIHQFMFGN
jgi:hypothetical protein